MSSATMRRRPQPGRQRRLSWERVGGLWRDRMVQAEGWHRFLLGLLSSPFLRAVALELRPHRHERDTAPAP